MNFTPVAKRLMAKRIKKLETAAQSPVETQVRQLRWLLFHGANSKFGKEADFESVLHLGDPRLAFSRLIPARDYETLRPYAMRMLRGEKDVLWPAYPPAPPAAAPRSSRSPTTRCASTTTTGLQTSWPSISPPIPHPASSPARGSS